MNEKTPESLLQPDDQVPNYGAKKFPRITRRERAAKRSQLKKQGLTDKQIEKILKDAQIPKDIEGSPHQGVKKDQEGNPILAIAKGGMVRKKKTAKKKTAKKKTAKKSKFAGRAAKRGYGMAKRGK